MEHRKHNRITEKWIALCALFALLFGALWLIAPCWQPGYAAGNYLAPAQGEQSGETMLLDINAATREQLMDLPGIGQAKADAILAYRARHGYFASAEELAQVDGISQKMVDGWADKITAG